MPHATRLHVGRNAMLRAAVRREAQLRMRLSLAKLKVQAIAAKVRLRAALAAERKELARMTVATGERIQIENAIRARNKIVDAITLGESGNGHSELLERVELLERLHLRAPPLPDYLEKPWPSLRDWFAVAHYNYYPPTKKSGIHFLSTVTKVMNKLGPHLSGATEGVKGKGDADAFKSFVIVLARSKALKERARCAFCPALLSGLDPFPVCRACAREAYSLCGNDLSDCEGVAHARAASGGCNPCNASSGDQNELCARF